MTETVQTLHARLLALDSAVVSDVLDEAGFPHQVVSNALSPLDASAKLVGIAVCARGEPRVAVADPSPGSSVDAIEAALTDGAVAVLDTGGFTAGACIGGFVALEFQRRGCVGMITDGAIRDAPEIRDLGLSVFSRGATPINGSRRWSWVEVGKTVTLPGQTGPAVRVDPGDWVLGDADGAVVIPSAVAEEVISMAEELARIEGAITDAMRSGEPRAAAMEANPRFRHIRCLQR